jgi:hypothetical protein
LEGVDYFIPHLSSKDWVTQMYAAAAVQNMCQNVEFASSLKDRDALKPLRNLLRSTQPAVVRFAAGALKNIGDAYELSEEGQEGQEGETSSAKPPETSLRSLTQLAKRWSQASKKPRLLQEEDVEMAVKARVQEDQQRHVLEVKAALLVQTRWRGIFAREDADVIREYRGAGAVITNLLRRSPKGVEILQRRAAILAQSHCLKRLAVRRKRRTLRAIVLVQSSWRRSVGTKLTAQRRVAIELYRKAEGEGGGKANTRCAYIPLPEGVISFSTMCSVHRRYRQMILEADRVHCVDAATVLDDAHPEVQMLAHQLLVENCRCACSPECRPRQPSVGHALKSTLPGCAKDSSVIRLGRSSWCMTPWTVA